MIRHVTRPCPNMTTSIIIKITRLISMWTPHWITVSCHGVEGPITTVYYAQFFHFVAEEKKRDDKKNKGILWLGYHRYPSNYSNRMTYHWLVSQLQPLHEANAREQIQESCDNQAYMGPGLGTNFFLTVEGPSYLFNLLWRRERSNSNLC